MGNAPRRPSARPPSPPVPAAMSSQKLAGRQAKMTIHTATARGIAHVRAHEAAEPGRVIAMVEWYHEGRTRQRDAGFRALRLLQVPAGVAVSARRAERSRSRAVSGRGRALQRRRDDGDLFDARAPHRRRLPDLEGFPGAPAGPADGRSPQPNRPGPVPRSPALAPGADEKIRLHTGPAAGKR